MSQQDASPAYMSRGVLTPAEKQAIQGEEDDPNKQSTYIARVKQRMTRVEEDARLLRTHRPDLYEQLHAAVCEEEFDERIQRLEQQVAALQEQTAEANDE
jgi:polyhydroxyalkanoate synthesis regulator phasin